MTVAATALTLLAVSVAGIALEPVSSARADAVSPASQAAARTIAARRASAMSLGTVPGVVKLSGTIAVRRLRAAGYQVWVGKPRYDAKVVKGRISVQVLKAGSRLRKRRTVTVYQSLGPAPTYAWKQAKASTYGGGSENQSVAGPFPSTGTLESHGVLYFAHKRMPFGTTVVFRYGSRTAVAICVDRGPYVGGREFDLGANTARALGFGGVGSLDFCVTR